METNDNSITQYDEFAVKHLAAFNAFTTIYEAKNPRPQLERVRRDLVSLIIILALTVVMIAAVIVSGSRTIDEFHGGFIGLIAFIMVEGGIMAYAFFRARRTVSKKRVEQTVKWATAGLVFTVIVGLGANIDNTLRSHDVFMPEIVRTGINLLIAISAPALGFISSDVLAIELMALDFKRAEAQKDFRKALEKWQRGLNTEWKNQQGRWGVKIQVDVPRLSNGIPLENTGISPAKSTLGHKKVPDATQRVSDYFTDNPDALNGNPLEIAALLGVGKSTVYNYLKAHKDGNS